ncbi:hypothetical protein Hanom_Chr09g00846461 [Helianthus anomalus]
MELMNSPNRTLQSVLKKQKDNTTRPSILNIDENVMYSKSKMLQQNRTISKTIQQLIEKTHNLKSYVPKSQTSHISPNMQHYNDFDKTH